MIRILVYLDTTVPSDVHPKKVTPQTRAVLRFWQKVTRRGSKIEPMVSEYVLRELDLADDKRLIVVRNAMLRGVRCVPKRPLYEQIAARIQKALRLGPKNNADVIHVVVAALNAAEYLVTSDKALCGLMGRRICYRLAEMGYQPPMIVRPDDFTEQTNPRSKHAVVTPGTREVHAIRRRIVRAGGRTFRGFINVLFSERKTKKGRA